MTPRRTAMTAAVMFIIVAAIYVLRLDTAAGLIVDDAWYMVLAKALASGEGFRLVSSSAAPIVPPSVPPGFPALLSIVFALHPSYPGNLLLLKLVSCIAMAGVGVACWIDFTRNRGVAPEHALWLVTAVVLTPAFLFLAASTVMADCVFTLAQLLTVMAVERTGRRDAADVRAPIAAGILAAAAFLIRTTGLAVVVAGIAYFVVQRRWRQGLIFAAVIAATVSPWQLYARANAPTNEQRQANGGTIAYSYGQLLSRERPSAERTAVSPVQFLARAADNLGNITMRDVGALILPVLYRTPAESGMEVISVGRPGRGSMGGATGTMIVSTVLCLVIAAGIVRARAWFSMPALLIAASLPMIAAVGSQTFRYVVPLAPLLLFFLWRAITLPAAARIALMCVVGFQAADHAQYLYVKATATPPWLVDAREVDAALVWMNANLTEEGAVASSNPGLVYLRTGRKGVVSSFPLANWEKWKAAGIRYVVALRRTQLPRSSLKDQVIYQSPGGLWIVRM